MRGILIVLLLVLFSSVHAQKTVFSEDLTADWLNSVYKSDGGHYHDGKDLDGHARQLVFDQEILHAPAYFIDSQTTLNRALEEIGDDYGRLVFSSDMVVSPPSADSTLEAEVMVDTAMAETDYSIIVNNVTYTFTTADSDTVYTLPIVQKLVATLESVPGIIAQVRRERVLITTSDWDSTFSVALGVGHENRMTLAPVQAIRPNIGVQVQGLITIEEGDRFSIHGPFVASELQIFECDYQDAPTLDGATYVNPVWFGANRRGANIDTTTNAFLSATHAGSVLQISEGSYLLQKCLVYKDIDNVVIQGLAGIRGVRLIADLDSAESVIQVWNSNSPQIRGIDIEIAEEANYRAESGVYIRDCTDAIIEDVVFTSWYNNDRPANLSFSSQMVSGDSIRVTIDGNVTSQVWNTSHEHTIGLLKTALESDPSVVGVGYNYSANPYRLYITITGSAEEIPFTVKMFNNYEEIDKVSTGSAIDAYTNAMPKRAMVGSAVNIRGGSGVRVENIKVYGGAYTGSRFTSTMSGVILDCEFRETQRGVMVDDTSPAVRNASIRGNYFYNIKHLVAKFEQGSAWCQFIDNHILLDDDVVRIGTGGSLINVQADHSLLKGNLFKLTQNDLKCESGISVEYGGYWTQVTGNTIKGGRFKDASSSAVGNYGQSVIRVLMLADDEGYVTVSDNIIESPYSGRGILINNPRCKVQNNQIFSHGASELVSGIMIRNRAHDVQVTGNYISEGRIGIEVINANNVQVTGNSLTDCQAAGVYVHGRVSGGMVANNIIRMVNRSSGAGYGGIELDLNGYEYTGNTATVMDSTSEGKARFMPPKYVYRTGDILYISSTGNAGIPDGEYDVLYAEHGDSVVIDLDFSTLPDDSLDSGWTVAQRGVISNLMIAENVIDAYYKGVIATGKYTYTTRLTGLGLVSNQLQNTTSYAFDLRYIDAFRIIGNHSHEQTRGINLAASTRGSIAWNTFTANSTSMEYWLSISSGGDQILEYGNQAPVTYNNWGNVTNANRGVNIISGSLTSGTRSGGSSPSGSITPLAVGEEYLDTSGPTWYKATGTANTDWVAVN